MEKENNIIILDGVRAVLSPKDLNGDGKVGGVEVLKQDIALQPINNPTELGESLKEINMDTLDNQTRMSGIDMRSRLHYAEIGYVLALDSLVALGVCPTRCLAFTRQKKRLSVSLDGKGRQEFVDIVAGKRDLEAKTGFSGIGDRVKNFVTGGD